MIISGLENVWWSLREVCVVVQLRQLLIFFSIVVLLKRYGNGSALY